MADRLPPAPMVIRRDAFHAVAWGVAAIVLVVIGIALVVSSGGDPLSIVLLVLFGATAGYFLVAWIFPTRWEVVLDDDGIEVTLPWRQTRVAWDEVDFVRVTRLAGDPFLELHVVEDDRLVSRGAMLPFGADLAALDARLRRQFGVDTSAS